MPPVRAFRGLVAVASLLAGAAWYACAAEVPDGWTATSLERCDRDPAALRYPPPRKPETQFARYRLTTTREARVAQASVRWEFTPRRGVMSAEVQLVADTPLTEGFALWLKNPRGPALTAALRLTDGSGASCLTRPQPVVQAPRWTRYVFLAGDFLATGSSARPVSGRLDLVLGGLQAATDYLVYVDEIEALNAPLPTVRVEDLQFAPPAAAGQKLALQLALSAPEALPRPVTVEITLERDGVPASQGRLELHPDEVRETPVTLAATLPVPRHLAGGDYRVRLASVTAQLTGATGRDLSLTGAPAALRSAVACTPQSGCFLADGQALPVVGGWQSQALPSHDAPWVVIYLTTGATLDGASLPFWKGPESYDFSAVDRRLAEVLAANPEAYVLPVVSLAAPEWWKSQHPKELMVFGDGKSQLPDSMGATRRTEASWAGKTWRQEAATALTKLVQHLEQGPMGPAILGYALAAGEGGFWVYPGAGKGVFADYSAPQQEAFRDWLKRKYGEVKSLRLAWGQPAAPVTTAEGLKEAQPILGWTQARIPPVERRAHGAPTVVRDSKTGNEVLVYGVLHDPAASQDVVDYQVFASDLVAETIRLFARTVDKAVGGSKVVGAAYGLMFDLAATREGLTNGGQLALGPLAQAEELDFIVTPGAGGTPTDPPLLTTVSSTLAEHGKLWLGLAPATRGLGGSALPLCGRGVVAQEGYSSQSPSLPVRNLLSGADRRSVSEIAVVVDDISAAYLGGGSELSRPLLADQRLSLSLLGAPCDVWLLDDVLDGKAPRYKLYIFLDAFYLDAGSRVQLLQYLNAEPCTALWIYAAGALDQALGGRSMKELTGMILVQRSGRGPLQVRVDADPPYTYGAAQPLSPRFVCVDDQADVRGRLAGTDFGGLAVKPYGQIKSVWSAAPHLPASLLRAVARDAGVHLYAEGGDGIYACASLLAVRSAGPDHVIRLPQPADVYDLPAEKPVGKALREFSPGLPAGALGLYYLVAAGGGGK